MKAKCRICSKSRVLDSDQVCYECRLVDVQDYEYLLDLAVDNMEKHPGYRREAKTC